MTSIAPPTSASPGSSEFGSDADLSRSGLQQQTAETESLASVSTVDDLEENATVISKSKEKKTSKNVSTYLILYKGLFSRFGSRSLFGSSHQLRRSTRIDSGHR